MVLLPVVLVVQDCSNVAKEYDKLLKNRLLPIEIQIHFSNYPGMEKFAG